MPGSALKSKFVMHGGDKVVHFILFFVLTLLFASSNYFKTISSIILYLILISLYIYGIELGQKYLASGRSYEFMDMVADMAGTFAALAICIFHKILTNKSL